MELPSTTNSVPLLSLRQSKRIFSWSIHNLYGIAAAEIMLNCTAVVFHWLQYYLCIFFYNEWLI